MACALLGCGGAGDGFNGPRGTVSGKLTFQGKAVPPGSLVTFQAKDGPAFIATGIVKEDGKYGLVYRDKTELPAVTYLVQITPPVAPPAASIDPKSANPAKGIVGDSKALTDAAKAAKLPFPAKFAATTTSKLSFEVKAGSNTADFDLKE